METADPIGFTEEFCAYAAAGPSASTRLFFHRPSPSPPKAGVVLVPTIGDERRSMIRTEVEIARSLAGRGMEVIRFDPAGDPDSPVEPEDRSLEALMRDLRNAIDTAPEPLFAVAFRAGNHVLASASVETLRRFRGLFLIAPVTGERFVGDLRKRRGLRKMLSGPSRESAPPPAGCEDFDGCIFPSDFLEEFSAPSEPSCILPFAAVQIGPAGHLLKDTTAALTRWMHGGAFPAPPPSVPPPFITPDGRPEAIIWRHRVLWGQTEHSDVSPLADVLFRTLETWLKAPPRTPR